MVNFNYVQTDEPLVICDTNVWYWIAMGKYVKPNDLKLTPTSLTLMELMTSETMIHDTVLFSEVLHAIYDEGSAVIVTNPFDFVINANDPYYRGNSDPTLKVLNDITDFLKKEITGSSVIDEELRVSIINECKNSRLATVEFAENSTLHLKEIRKNINIGIGQKKHLKENTTEINREMVKAILNNYLQDFSYEIDFDKFDWSRIELFMNVTETFFKKLETTKNMKMKPNDAVDWYNLLYVTSKDKYLTFENKWRGFMENDPHAAKYLFEY